MEEIGERGAEAGALVHGAVGGPHGALLLEVDDGVALAVEARERALLEEAVLVIARIGGRGGEGQGAEQEGQGGEQGAQESHRVPGGALVYAPVRTVSHTSSPGGLFILLREGRRGGRVEELSGGTRRESFKFRAKRGVSCLVHLLRLLSS